MAFGSEGVCVAFTPVYNVSYIHTGQFPMQQQLLRGCDFEGQVAALARTIVANQRLSQA